MTKKNSAQPGPLRLRRFLWWAQIASVLFLAALAWWLPDLVGIQRLPGAYSILFLIGVASVPLIFIVGSRLKAAPDAARKEAGLSADATKENQGLSSYILVLALAELPAILGLIYVLLGGLPLQGLMLAAGSFVLLFIFSPG